MVRTLIWFAYFWLYLLICIPISQIGRAHV